MPRTPSAPAGAAEAAADGVLGGRRGGGPAPPPQTAEEAVATARAYAESIADGVIERDRAGNAPVAELAAAGRQRAAGDHRAAFPRRPRAGAPALAEVIRTIAAVDPAIAQVPQAHFLFVDVLAVWGTARQQRALFGEVLGGARLGNGLAERGGQHAQDLRTRLHGFPTAAGPAPAWPGASTTAPARSRPAGSGSARWTTSAGWCWRSSRRDAPGVHVDDDWNVMGQRATVSGTATFDDVPVDPGLVVPLRRAPSRCRSSSARGPSWCTPRSRPGSRAARCATPASSSGPGRARSSRPPRRAGRDTAGEDPHTIHRYGQLATQVRAAEALLASAAATLDEVGRVPADAAAAARGSLAVAQAKAFASEVAVEVASDLFSLSGASAADERYDLCRHWRNARTHASHDPVDWKYHHVGNFLLNDVLPPNHGQL